jgi:non-heme chloroperoxidase
MRSDVAEYAGATEQPLPDLVVWKSRCLSTPKLNQPAQFLKRIESGSGYPVVLVHGSASDYRTWEHQIEPLGAHFHVVAYSRRFHWPNDRIAEGAEYSMADQIDDLVNVLQTLDSDSAHVVGHSYGAYLALMVAIKNPNLVRSLVLAEAPVIPLFTSFPPEPLEILKLLTSRPKTALSIIKFVATGLGPATAAARQGDMDVAMARFGKAVLGKKAFYALSQDRLEQVRRNFIKAELLSDNFMIALNEDDVANIKARTLLVTGEHSPAFLRCLTDRLEELIVDCQRVEIPNASHIMHEDNADAYNRAVLEFLRT